jgi:tRNA-Thr(GGU) m(6)t(6)A37 methyltransferase TsaA
MYDITLKPIGVVSNAVKDPGKHDWRVVESEILVNADLTEALDRIDEYSYLVILYWMHNVKPSHRFIQKVHPRGRQDLPMVGVFASRSPARPNPIGMTTVKLLSRQDNVLRVVSLDAVDGTPVLDIKPYIPDHDADKAAQTPEWLSCHTDST